VLIAAELAGFAAAPSFSCDGADSQTSAGG